MFKASHTDNSASYRAGAFTRTVEGLASRHQRIRPYTPHHNGKAERNNRIMAEECLYTRELTSQTQRRKAIAVVNTHDNYHRPHPACRDQPPATRVPTTINNLTIPYI